MKMVAIKGMKMPNECYNCPLLDGEEATCNIIGETEVDITEERAKNCPLVEIEERKVGKWLGERGYPICEKCGCNIYEKYISCSDYAEIITKMDYCPKCGAEMRSNEKGKKNKNI